MATQKPILNGLGALLLLLPALHGCGSDTKARPAALDPSNPDGPESPKSMLYGSELAAPSAAGTAASASPNAGAPTIYVCPMHPEVTSDRAGHCPKCGMKLIPRARSVTPDARATPGAIVPASGRGSP